MSKTFGTISRILLVFALIYLASSRKDTDYDIVRSAAATDLNRTAYVVLNQKLSHRISSCMSYSSADPVHQLAQATLLVENVLTNPLEQRIEKALVLWLPGVVTRLDLSVGPAQIKPSSFERNGQKTPASVKEYASVCGAFNIVSERIKHIVGGGVLSYKKRHAFTESHTGLHSNKIQNILYNELVDRVYFLLVTKWNSPTFNENSLQST